MATLAESLTCRLRGVNEARSTPPPPPPPPPIFQCFQVVSLTPPARWLLAALLAVATLGFGSGAAKAGEEHIFCVAENGSGTARSYSAIFLDDYWAPESFSGQPCKTST